MKRCTETPSKINANFKIKKFEWYTNSFLKDDETHESLQVSIETEME